MGIGAVVLASQSPRRRELLTELGLDLTIVSPHVIERRIDGESPADEAKRLAQEKSIAGSLLASGSRTIGADTIVDLDGVALGKPEDRDDARRMLTMLSGRSHLVHTGVAVAIDGRLLASDVVTTKVFFADLSSKQIEDFIALGIADDKAGSYSIQGRGAPFVERIEGDFYCVVGLPIFRLTKMLSEIADGEGGDLASR